MTNASPQSLDGALCLNSSDLSFLPAATGQTMTCSTNPAWLMFLTSVKWERSPQNADYLAPKCTQAYPAAEHEMKSLQMWFHLKGTMGRLPSYLGTKWLFYFHRNMADLYKRPSCHYGSQRSPSGEADQPHREKCQSVSTGEEEERRRRGVRE